MAGTKRRNDAMDRNTVLVRRRVQRETLLATKRDWKPDTMAAHRRKAGEKAVHVPNTSEMTIPAMD
jgi:hypothetical protein